jgi:hypothetical protein
MPRSIMEARARLRARFRFLILEFLLFKMLGDMPVFKGLGHFLPLLGRYNDPYSRKIVLKTSRKPGNPADFRAKYYSGRHLVDLRQNAKMQPLAPQGVAFVFW